MVPVRALFTRARQGRSSAVWGGRCPERRTHAFIEHLVRAVYPACLFGGWFIVALMTSMSSAILSRARAWSWRACTSSS